MRIDLELRVGTAAGTLLSVGPTILTYDIIKTILLAVVGATVSFLVSLFLQWVTRSRK